MKTLLVLDDEPAVIKLLRHVLKEYELIEATTAEQALRLFIGRDRQIDLLVADVSLPTSSGIQVALLLRLALPNLPVILTSGYPVSAWNDGDFADMERLGSRSVIIIQKPFEPQVLSNAVHELIKSRRPKW